MSLLKVSTVLQVYMSLGDLLDILVLINNGINFILYCSMSKQFRDTFICVFRLNMVCRPEATSLHDSASCPDRAHRASTTGVPVAAKLGQLSLCAVSTAVRCQTTRANLTTTVVVTTTAADTPWHSEVSG